MRIRCARDAREVKLFAGGKNISTNHSTTYPVFLAHAAGVLQVAGPSQTEGAHLEVAVREHVRQTEGVVVLLCVGLGVCVCVKRGEEKDG